jgi:hypothetical protein
MNHRALLLLLPVCALSSSACVLGPEPAVARNVTDGEYCVAQHLLETPRSHHAPPERADVKAPTAVTRGFSARTMETARAIGALSQLERLAQAEASNAPQAEIVDLRGQLNDAIALATLDLSSTVAHIQCEEGRAEQIATDLRDAEKEQTRNLTAYSLVVTAAAAIGAGVLAITNKGDPTPTSAVGIGGGVLGAGFGAGTLFVHRSTSYRHARNILGEVWLDGDHPDFPEIVWAYITRPEFTRSGKTTIRAELIESWKESGRLGPDAQHIAPDRVALYFGGGGIYDADGLDDRADMLSEVREAIDLMNHDLTHVAGEAANR